MIDDLEKIIHSISTKNASDSRAHLINLINELIDTDFQSLLFLLYKIDVNEEKLKLALNNHIGFDAAPIIADLIIKRQIEKIKSREKYSNSHTSSEEEKW